MGKVHPPEPDPDDMREDAIFPDGHAGAADDVQTVDHEKPEDGVETAKERG